jgi:hypothetical protein
MVPSPPPAPPAAVKECVALVYAAQRAWLRRIFPDDAGIQAAVAKQMAELRAELAGPESTALELLLVERVVITWLQLQGMESTCASRNLDPAVLARFEHRRDQAHRRYLSAIKALAQVRRLRLPAMQVNVAVAGGQQVNVVEH